MLAASNDPFRTRARTPLMVCPAIAAALLTTLSIAAPIQESAGAGAGSAPTAPAATGPYWATVKGDNVMVRSVGRVQGAYPYHRLFSNQPVKVLETSYGWAKLQAIGPSFANTFGFVKASNATQYDAAKKKLALTGKASLSAANLEANFAPEKSWQEIIVLNAGETLDVVEEVKTADGTFYSVRLPERAFGWVNLQFLTPMSQTEADALEASLRGPAATPSAPVPQESATAPEPSATPPVTPPTTPPATPPANPPAAAPATPGTAPSTDSGTTPPTPPPVVNNPPVEPAAPTAEELAAREERARAEQIARERQVRQATYADLEATWSRVRREPAEGAELAALRERYVALATDGATPVTTRELASARAEQLALRIEAQDALIELANQRMQLAERKQSLADLELAAWKRRAFDAVGRLSASTVYDGDRLPLLYKLAEPTTGYTLAYVIPGPGFTPSEALGLVVGLKGRKRYDETLRVPVYEPEIIEVLDPAKTAVIPDR